MLFAFLRTASNNAQASAASECSCTTQLCHQTRPCASRCFCRKSHTHTTVFSSQNCASDCECTASYTGRTRDSSTMAERGTSAGLCLECRCIGDLSIHILSQKADPVITIERHCNLRYPVLRLWRQGALFLSGSLSACPLLRPIKLTLLPCSQDTKIRS